MSIPLRRLTFAAMLAALYVVLTLPFAQIAFGPIQFRLAEALTVLPALNPAAIPGVFVGCLLANFLNPQTLGPVDLFAGSLATLLAALLTWRLGRTYRRQLRSDEARRSLFWPARLWVLLPPIVLNGLIVGSYLPFLLLAETPTLPVVLLSILSLTLCQSVVIVLIGLPLLRQVERLPSLWNDCVPNRLLK